MLNDECGIGLGPCDGLSERPARSASSFRIPVFDSLIPHPSFRIHHSAFGILDPVIP